MKKLLTVLLLAVAPGLYAQTDTLAPAQTGDTVLTQADQMPQFKGGEPAFQQYLQQTIRYPLMEKEKGQSGTVYISFVVKANGEIADVFCMRGVEGAPGLGKEGVRVISGIPAWEPGVQNGKKVSVRMVIPIRFMLDDVKKKRKRKNR